MRDSLFPNGESGGIQRPRPSETTAEQQDRPEQEDRDLQASSHSSSLPNRGRPLTLLLLGLLEWGADQARVVCRSGPSGVREEAVARHLTGEAVWARSGDPDQGSVKRR